MRVALLAPLPPVQSGIADYADAWRSAMQGAGVEVVTPPQVEGDGSVWPSAEHDFWTSVDVVHAELGGGRSREFLALEALQAHRPGLPLTATVHDPERLVWRHPAPGAAARAALELPRPLPQLAGLLQNGATLKRERQLAARMTRLVTLTRTGAQCLRERMRLPEQNVHFIPHGNHAIAPLAPIDSDELKLLYFGFIYPGKGIEDLLAALAQVRKARPGASLCLTLAGGSSPDLTFGSRGGYLDVLRQQAERNGIADLIHWQLDLSAAKIVSCIQAHHVLVLPYQESWRISVLGRMRGTSGALSWANACGRGVIASSARAFEEEVSHGNGAVFPQGDVDALARQIIEVLDDRSLAICWAAGAQALGQQRRWENVAIQFRDLFASLPRMRK
jgi:glycosyltransferase involved in cell wall biosynthesis